MKRRINHRSCLELSATTTVADSVGSTTVFIHAMSLPVQTSGSTTNIKLMATANVTSRTPDVYDQHFYPSAAGMVNDSTFYNTRSQSAPKIFVGEYASQEGKPTPNLNSAGDAAFLAGLKRNLDVFILASYAPLFATVNALKRMQALNMFSHDISKHLRALYI